MRLFRRRVPGPPRPSGLRRVVTLAVGSALAAALGTVLTPLAASAAPPSPTPITVTVGPANLVECPPTVECLPSSPRQFSVVNQSGGTGSVSLVSGPAPPPDGTTGSLQMSLTADGDHWTVFNDDHVGTPLSALTALSYFTYTDTLPYAPTLQLEINPGNTTGGPDEGVTYSTLNFEPYLNADWQTMQTSTWQYWNVLAGRVWGTHLTGATEGSPLTWSQFLADYPNATIVGGVGVNVGSGWSAMTGNADARTIATATTTTTTPAVGTSTTTSTTQPPPPGPLTVDGTAWQGHGDLAFVSEGQLEVLGNNGTLTAITGPTGGTDTNPSWSPGGRWLAFLSTGPPTGFSVPAPTLWVVQVGHSVAQEVTSSGIGQFAWSPAVATSDGMT